MFDEYRIICNDLSKEHDIQYQKIDDRHKVNGVSWYLIDELKAAVNQEINNYGFCAAFTTILEGNNPNLFKDRCLIAINLVNQNSLI